MKPLLVITELEQLKSISDPFRIQLLSLMADGPKTGQMLADTLALPRAKVHYHLNQLLSHNIITIHHTEEKNSIIQKFYQPAARKIIPSANIFNFNHTDQQAAPAVYNIKMNNADYENFSKLLSDKEQRKISKKETATADEYAVYVLKI